MLATLIALLLIVLFSSAVAGGTIEAFGTYDKCRARGFSKEFCVTTPNAVLGVGYCQCPNGSLGMQLPGFRGRCVCEPSAWGL